MTKDTPRWLDGRYLLLYMAAAVAVRVLLFLHFPALLTNDSPDYVNAAYDIYTRLDFGSKWIGSVRMPGYGAFLAALYPLTGVRSDLLVAAQGVVGLLCVPLGWAIGGQLRSPRVAHGLAIFLAFNPVYLLLEHALMTEGLALALMLLSTLLVLLWLQQPQRVGMGLAAAVTIGLGGLVRVNLLPYGAVLIALPAGQWLVQAWRTRRWEVRPLLAVLLPPLVGLLVTLGPWLWRNYALYDTLSLSEHSDRSLLMWKTMSSTMDSNLPLFQQYAGGHAALDYYWLNEFNVRHAPVEAEAIAAAIIAEQVQAHPSSHLRAMVRSALNHIGIFIEGYVPRDDRAMVAYWFTFLVPDPAAVEGSVPAVQEWLDFRPVMDPSPWTAFWSAAGTVYLQVLRQLLFAALVAAVLRVAFCVWRRQLPLVSLAAYPVYAVMGLAAAYGMTLAFHAFTLTGSDRFAVLSDWVALAIVLWVFPREGEGVTG